MNQDPESEEADVCLINSLPNELLVKLFTYLNRNERLGCKVVCLRWYDLLQYEPYFRLDRHLCFDHCLLSDKCAPVTVFSQSKSRFESLTVGYVKITDSIEHVWRNIGADLRELNILHLDSGDQVVAVLGTAAKDFPQLKILHLNFRCWSPDLKIFIETVEVAYLENFCNTTNAFESFLKAFPGLQKIYIRSVDYFEGLSLNKIKDEAAKIKDLGQNFFQYGVKGKIWRTQWDQDSQTKTSKENEVNLFDIIVQEELRLERLDYRVRENEGFDELSFILACQPSLKEVSLSCNTFPPTFFSQITELNVGFMFDIISFEPLTALKNLRQLEISLSDMYDDNELSPCFFSHELLGGGTKLRNLTITTDGEKNCPKCWQNLFYTYRNLEAFTLSNHGQDQVVVSLIFENLFNLRELHLIRQLGNLHRKAKCYKKCPQQYPRFNQLELLSNWQPMPRLEKITLSRVTQISKAGVENFCKMCPNVSYLKLNDENVQSPDEIFEVLARGLRHLEILKVDLETPGVTSKLADSIANHCRRLKVLELGRNELRQVPEWKKRQLFALITTLKLIKSIYWDPSPSTRTQFYEAVVNSKEKENSCDVNVS